MKKISLSWGDLPIYHIDIENDTACLYRKINGSRDGCMSFPDGYFDQKKILLDTEKKRKLSEFLKTFDFEKWHTDEIFIYNIEHGAILYGSIQVATIASKARWNFSNTRFL